jgi:hypothetical protein
LGKPDLGEQWWIDSIVDTMAIPHITIVAEDFLREYDTYSRPVVLNCSDGRTYVVKAVQEQARAHLRRVPRAMFTDQVVGRLGAQMEAPVGRVVLVEIPAELIAIEPRLAHVLPGVAHGCEWINDVHDALDIGHVDTNLERFASLSVLYGWFQAEDHQFLYDNTAPHHVYSVDHGHFLPLGPEWTRQSLRASGPPYPDPQVIGAAGLGQALRPGLKDAALRLRGIGDADIVRAVAAPPKSWGVSVPDRVALGKYLAARRDDLVQSLSRL